MQLGSLTSWISEMQAAASAYVGKAESYVINSLVNFRDKRGALNYAINKLKANAPKTSAPESLKAEYSAKLAAATDAKSKADWLGRIADEFTNITGLGVLPAVVAGVGVPVLLAAIASLVILIPRVIDGINYYVGASKVADAARAAGQDEAAALNRYYAANPANQGGIFGDVSRLIWPVALAGVAYLLITDQRSKRR